MSNHPQPTDKTTTSPATHCSRVSHRHFVIKRSDDQPWFVPEQSNYLTWLPVPEDAFVISLNAVTRQAVVIEGRGLRKGDFEFYLPADGYIRFDDAPPRVLPKGIYSILPANIDVIDAAVDAETEDCGFMKARLPDVEIPSSAEAAWPAIAPIAQLQRGWRWIEIAASTAPLPPAAELRRLCEVFYAEVPTLGGFKNIRLCEDWDEFAKEATRLAPAAITGLEIISRTLVGEELTEFPITTMVELAPAREKSLIQSLPEEPWSIELFAENDHPEFPGESLCHIDLRWSVPLQLRPDRAWALETALNWGHYTRPINRARALLAIWESVGAFIPLNNGTALICARTAETSLRAQ